MKLTLTRAEYEHLTTAVEGALEELELLMVDLDWYTTELTDRLDTCLEILGKVEE